MAPIPGKDPAQVTIDSSFSKSEKKDIETALKIWNYFSETSLHRDFFKYHVGDIDPAPGKDIPSPSLRCAFEDGPQSFRIIRMTDKKYWKEMGLKGGNFDDEATAGVTARCYEDDTNATLLRQVMLINTDYAVGRKFLNVVLHELGHAVGLDHSCDSSNSHQKNFISCDEVGPYDDYAEAVMYPAISDVMPTGDGTATEGWRHLKFALGRNDMERAYCLYKN